MYRYLPLLAALGLALAACNIDDATPSEAPPTLSTRANGEVEVAFASGCTVLFGPGGKELASGSSCSGDQQHHARQSFRAYRAEQDPSTYSDV